MAKKKDIGLLTIHDTQNFGSLMQTACTCWALRRLGADFQLIDYKNVAIAQREHVRTLREVRSLKMLLRWLRYDIVIGKKVKGFWHALRQAAEITPAYDKDTVKAVNEMFGSFLVGSDIVWGEGVTGSDWTYFLDFSDAEKKKFSFSSSIGESWSPENREKIATYLRRFQSIAVREQEAAEWVRETAGVEALETCDPTMLFDAAFWQQYAAPVRSGKPYVLVYMEGGPEPIRHACEYAKAHHCAVWVVKYGRPIPGTRSVRPCRPEDWVALFKHAQTVFTASYHGLLFSLYTHRNVFFYNIRNGKSRINALAEEFRISHREYSEENFRKDLPIDYDYVEQVMAQKRQVSWDRLAEIVSAAKQD